MHRPRLFARLLITLAAFTHPCLAVEATCKAAAGTEGCFIARGRIAVSNGIGPNLWRIGTTRRYGLFMDEAAFPTLERFLTPHHLIFGTFLLCPLSPDVPGELRSVCVAGADSLVVQAEGSQGSAPKEFRPACPECKPLRVSE
jgi:hypothetical protein